MSTPLVSVRTDKPAKCGAWAELYPHQVWAVRRGIPGTPRHEGWINNSATCGLRFNHAGWHEAGMRPNEPEYGGGEIGIRWNTSNGRLNGCQVVLLEPLR